MKKKKSWKREVSEWLVFILIIGFLYFSGLYTPVMGALQGLVLKTGIIQPSTEMEDTADANYNFVLLNEEGKEVDFAEFKGKTVFLNLWATWCPPCVAEMPDINDLYNELEPNENVSFVMLSFDKSFQKAIDFKKKKNFDFPVYTLATPLPGAYESGAIPTTFILSPSGEIVMRKEGMAKYNTKKFRKFIAEISG
jgi:thiol-disulfide isomerase/thioredoxin